MLAKREKRPNETESSDKQRQEVAGSAQ